MSGVTSVLVVDDEPAIRGLLVRWIESIGLQPSDASNAEEALAAMKARHHDLAVIDVIMPGHDGLWLAGELRRDHPHTAIVLATGHRDLMSAAAQNPSVADFLVKPFQRERFLQALDRSREWRRNALDDLEAHTRLSRELRDRIAQMCLLVNSERRQGVDEARWLRAVATNRTPDVVKHSDRVAAHCIALARQLKLAKEQVSLVERAALFHDIGKVAIPDSILAKPAMLTPVERAIMRRHVEAGGEILEATESLSDAAAAVWASHEWFGGGGYPHKLRGSAIPLASRLIAVADAYDSMTECRPYRKGLDPAEAISELLRQAPSQFDPDVVMAFLRVAGNP
jgi:putative two-component system response regulator